MHAGAGHGKGKEGSDGRSARRPPGGVVGVGTAGDVGDTVSTVCSPVAIACSMGRTDGTLSAVATGGFSVLCHATSTTIGAWGGGGLAISSCATPMSATALWVRLSAAVVICNCALRCVAAWKRPSVSCCIS